MVYPEVCSLIKNNAICEHTLKLASEATVCWCPLILSTIGVFSTFHFESCTFLNPLSAVMSFGSSSADGGRKYLTKNLCLQPPSAGSVNIINNIFENRPEAKTPSRTGLCNPHVLGMSQIASVQMALSQSQLF